MSDLNEDVESEEQGDPWRKRATTTARYDLCKKCTYYVPQVPYQPGVRCRFELRPNVEFQDNKAVAKCEVFKKRD